MEDQRFVYSRPDVLSFTMDSLTEDLTVTGKIMAHLFASTSGTDADWIVKLIDVYPDFDTKSLSMSGYQLPVAMEVFRGDSEKSFSNPSALVPNNPEEFVIDLHDINHTFKKGHRIMLQVQSTWFPVIDRNPQKFVPNIFEAKDTDFIKAEHRIYFSAQYPTYIELPVMNN
ncbi:MAG: CocE/NonD family hydrolase [Chitinophagaceae bacterium]|nr:CocE/NonD family hydrolase [Chitinophagaceae bacterium]